MKHWYLYPEMLTCAAISGALSFIGIIDIFILPQEAWAFFVTSVAVGLIGIGMSMIAEKDDEDLVKFVKSLRERMEREQATEDYEDTFDVEYFKMLMMKGTQTGIYSDNKRNNRPIG